MSKKKYMHYVYAIFKNGNGCFEVLNDTPKYKLRSQVNELNKFIQSKNGLSKCAVISIFTVKNDL